MDDDRTYALVPNATTLDSAVNRLLVVIVACITEQVLLSLLRVLQVLYVLMLHAVLHVLRMLQAGCPGKMLLMLLSPYHTTNYHHQDRRHDASGHKFDVDRHGALSSSQH